jgi:hypothetical protein
MKKGREKIMNRSKLVSARFRQYRASSRIKGRVFDLTKKDVRDLCLSPCFYCGNIDERDEGRPNGIDRKDNKEGYTKENSVSACAYCNHMKSDSSEEAFLGHALRIVFYQFSRHTKEEQANFLRLIQNYGCTNR